MNGNASVIWPPDAIRAGIDVSNGYGVLAA